MILIARPYLSPEDPVSLPTSTAEIRNAFQQSRPRKRSKRPTGIFEIAEDQEHIEKPPSLESAPLYAIDSIVHYRSDITLRKGDTALDYTSSSRIVKAGRELCLPNATSTVPSCLYGSGVGLKAGPERRNNLSAKPKRNTRRNAPARAPLRGLHEDLNTPALVFDRPGANHMKENVPPGWQDSSSECQKNEKTLKASSQVTIGSCYTHETKPVSQGLLKSSQNPSKIASRTRSSKKAKSSHVWRPGNSLRNMAHKPMTTSSSLQTLIPPSISSIKTFQPLTASFITFLCYYLATTTNSISSTKISTKRKAATMEAIVRSTHAKIQQRAAKEAETARIPAVVLIKTFLFAGRTNIQEFLMTWEIEKNLEYHKHVNEWLSILKKRYGVRAGSLHRRFSRKPLPVATLIKDYLLPITRRNDLWEPMPQSLEELLLQLGCSANSAAQFNKMMKKLDLDFLMGVVAVLALKAQSSKGNAPTHLPSLLFGPDAR